MVNLGFGNRVWGLGDRIWGLRLKVMVFKKIKFLIYD